MSILGRSVRRVEDPRFLRGEGRYVENLELPHAAHVTFVRSPFAHARITDVDVSAAAARPNTRVLTGTDVDIGPFEAPFTYVDKAAARPLIAQDVVRFVGDIVAALVTDTRAGGMDAAELVLVDYDPLPVVVDPAAALTDEVLLFPELGTNVCSRAGSREHDETLFDECEVVISQKLVSQRMAPCPLEPRSAAVEVDDEGRITAWLTTQVPHDDRDALAATLGLEASAVRVIGPDVGGGFGAKLLGVEEALVAWLARTLGRPMRWTETRSESMIALGHGRAQHTQFTIGGDRTGSVQAYRLDILQDAGAYPNLGAMLPSLTGMMACGVYRIPKVEVEAQSVVTNTTPVTSFRGAGRPEATQLIERAMDMFAREIDIDPAEVRRKNFIPRDLFPYTTAGEATYDSGDYEGALDLVLRTAGYADLREQQRVRRQQGTETQLGIGLSVYVEITNGVNQPEFAELEITPEGGAVLRTGTFSHGQGHETTFAMIVADRLGLPVDAIHVVKGDTDEIPRGGGTYGSKSTQVGGVAAGNAAEDVVERARRLVADILEANPNDIVLDTASGRFHVVGTPTRSVTWAQLATQAAADGRIEELKVTHDFEPTAPTFPFGAHLALVEIDTETGVVELRRMICVDDAGTLINPLIAEGQVHGGLATGIGQALYEEYVYDEDGNPQTSTFVGYAFPSAADLPSYEVVAMETPTPLNVLGVKGIGESATIGSTPAVHNAVVDALAPFGVRHVDMPANGENVWRALREVRANP